MGRDLSKVLHRHPGPRYPRAAQHPNPCLPGAFSEEAERGFGRDPRASAEISWCCGGASTREFSRLVRRRCRKEASKQDE